MLPAVAPVGVPVAAATEETVGAVASVGVVGTTASATFLGDMGRYAMLIGIMLS